MAEYPHIPKRSKAADRVIDEFFTDWPKDDPDKKPEGKNGKSTKSRNL